MNVINKIFSSPNAGDGRLEQDDTVLVMPRKVVNRLLAVALLSAFFIFVAGYFLGKRKAAEAFTAQVERESFSDKINFSLSTLYDRYQAKDAEVTEDTSEGNEIKMVESEPVEAQKVSVSSAAATPIKVEKPISPTKNVEAPKPGVKYQAQLVGGPSAMIQQFVKRLAKRGIEVSARRRVSKTAQGKTIYWHQAVTPQCATKKELENLIERIKKTEKLDGVRVIEINS